MSDNLLATIDLGSNSFRLLVAKVNSDSTITAIDQIKETVRLASGLDVYNNLTQEAQLRGLNVLARFAERLVEFKRNQVRVVATSTLRVANNSAEFIALANQTLGFPIEIISGKEEARLIYLGAIHSLAFSQERRLVIDIGGGSTEFIIGHAYEPNIMESVTMGCVSYTNRFFPKGALTESNFNQAILTARSKIQAMEHLFTKHDWQLAVGTSGTARTIYDMSVEYGLASEITYESMLQLKKLLIKCRNIKLISLNGIKEDRKAVIAGGLAIMLAIFKELDITRMTIADGALREGVMYDLIGRKANLDLRESTVNELKKRYVLDIKQGQRVANTALYIQSRVIIANKADLEQRKLLIWACELYEIGLSISHNDYHKHGAYIMQNSDLAGFSKPEQTIIADLIRAHRGHLAKIYERTLRLYKDKLKPRVFFALISFRLAVIFNRSRQNIGVVKIIQVENPTKSSYDLVIDQKWLEKNPLTLFSITEELAQWVEYGYKIKLVRR